MTRHVWGERQRARESTSRCSSSRPISTPISSPGRRHSTVPAIPPPLKDVTVDGGPLAPICPSGDTCPACFNGYAGDIEVDADIEMQLAVAPAARQLFVYNAPNDFTGQTELDEYTRIAKDNLADVISSSWAVCEQDVTAGYVQAENLIFEQMALQGQSMFGARRGHGRVLVHPQRRNHRPRRTRSAGPALGDECGRYLVRYIQPGDANPNPSYPTWRGIRLELPQPVQRERR